MSTRAERPGGGAGMLRMAGEQRDDRDGRAESVGGPEAAELGQQAGQGIPGPDADDGRHGQERDDG